MRRYVVLASLLPLVLSCEDDNIILPTTGSVVVATATSGDAPAGYTVTLDGALPQLIGANGTVTYSELEPGPHALALTELPAGCAVGGENPRTVNIEPGATAHETFAVTCSPVTAGIHIVTTSTGMPDLDGYLVSVDGAAPLPVAPAGEVTIPNIPAGVHTVTLSGLAPGCTVSGDNPQAVTVSPPATAEVTFLVNCIAPTLTWTRMESGTDFSLLSVWGSSPTDVFVTGEPGGEFTSTIFHYDGVAWSEQSVQKGLTLFGLWGSSATDIYAVGSDPLGDFEGQGAILHWDGAAWTVVPPTGIGLGEVVLYSVWGTSATDVFVVGEDFIGAPTALVAHFDGTEWNRFQLPEALTRILFDVHGTSPQDVWAVGYNDLDFFDSVKRPSLRRGGVALRKLQDVQGIILHYDGTSWTEVAVPERDVLFNGVWSAAPDDVFAVGQKGLRATAYHFDGTGWTQMTVPPVGQLFHVWGASASDVYAVGNKVILHFDGTAWTEVPATVPQLSWVWGSSALDVFAVGEGGTIMHGTP